MSRSSLTRWMITRRRWGEGLRPLTHGHRRFTCFPLRGRLPVGALLLHAPLCAVYELSVFSLILFILHDARSTSSRCSFLSCWPAVADDVGGRGLGSASAPRGAGAVVCCSLAMRHGGVFIVVRFVWCRQGRRAGRGRFAARRVAWRRLADGVVDFRRGSALLRSAGPPPRCGALVFILEFAKPWVY